jgi:flavin-dependent dehydrogenase
VLLTGDSAGLAYAQSGEGIRPAVESGLIAADVIVSAGGDYRSVQLAAFGERIEERFGGSKNHSDWSSMLPAAWLQRAAALLVPTRWFARHVIMNRWFLRANETPLAIRG